jgi:hypothetical protein
MRSAIVADQLIGFGETTISKHQQEPKTKRIDKDVYIDKIENV